MTGNFFILDRRVWAEVCKLGKNPAAAYLVLACGTQRDNRLTSWSVAAIKNYAGISVERGKQSVGALRDGVFIQQEKGGTRPQYSLLSWAERVKAKATSARSGQFLCPKDGAVYDAVRTGMQPSTDRGREIAKHLVLQGWLCDRGDGTWIAAEVFESGDPDLATNLIWLPNELVTGTKEGEPSPVERLRGRGDVMVLRLLIDLYHDQNLRDDGGIHRNVVRLEFDRVKVGEQGIYFVWAFKSKNCSITWTKTSTCHRTEGDQPASIFFNRLDVLRQEGLLTFIPHLCESSDVESEIIHPYGADWTEHGLNDLENALGLAAYRAGCAMADPNKRKDAENSGFFLTAPGSSAYPDVQLIGIARLRYRPHTKRTASWWGELQSSIPQHIERYKLLEAKAEEARAKVVRRA
jgi:hypothetical protein